MSLSPYTSFVDTTIAFVAALADTGVMTRGDEIDFWAWLLRQLGRHLTAYDLITFHYRGANYPDALLLDAVLKRYVNLIDDHLELFMRGGHGDPARGHRLRRGALRQACLLRRYYEGHAVPDAPTSPGENARILPPPHVRVPEEQLLTVSRRRKRLYADDPLLGLLSSAARSVLRESILDLAEASAWRELGSAVFIDRPFGWGKAVGEPDLTPLLAHVTWSPSIARRRFHELERLARELCLDDIGWDSLRTSESLPVTGLAADLVAEPDRPIVSLADARRVAPDFVVLCTLRHGLEEVFASFDFGPLRARTPFPDGREKMILARLPSPNKETVLAWLDGNMRKRLEMVPDLAEGFVTRGGRELPAAGLRVVRIWDEDGAECGVDITLPRRELHVGVGFDYMSQPGKSGC